MRSEESLERRLDIWQIEELVGFRTSKMKVEENSQDPEQNLELGERQEVIKRRNKVS